MLLNSFFDLPNSIILPFFLMILDLFEFHRIQTPLRLRFEGFGKYGIGHSKPNSQLGRTQRFLLRLSQLDKRMDE
jgi:hypothetical protein